MRALYIPFQDEIGPQVPHSLRRTSQNLRKAFCKEFFHIFKLACSFQEEGLGCSRDCVGGGGGSAYLLSATGVDVFEVFLCTLLFARLHLELRKAWPQCPRAL